MKALNILWSVSFVVLVSLNLNAKSSSGKFRMVKGDVKVKIASTGKTVKAMVGLKISAKDIIITAKRSRAKLIMVDGNTINLSPKTKLQLSKYVFDKKNNKKNVLLSVLYGKVRSKVKQKYDGKKNKFRIKTPSAVAGVRGTDFITSYNQTTKRSQVVTFEGRVSFGKISKTGKFLNPVSITAGQTSTMGATGAARPPTRVNMVELKKMEIESDPDANRGGPRVPSSEGQDQGQEQEGNQGANGEPKERGDSPGPDGETAANGPGPDGAPNAEGTGPGGPNPEGGGPGQFADGSGEGGFAAGPDGRGPASIDDGGGMPMMLESDFAFTDSPNGANFDPGGLEPFDPRLAVPAGNFQQIPVCTFCLENLQRTRLIINVTKSQ